MRLEIFTPDLSNRHEITHAISSQFSDLYNGIGKFSIVLPMDDYNISIAQNDALVYIVDRQLTYIVQEVVMEVVRVLAVAVVLIVVPVLAEVLVAEVVVQTALEIVQVVLRLVQVIAMDVQVLVILVVAQAVS